MATVDPMKEVQKAMWSLGDYREATRQATHGEELAAASGVDPGMAVLDVAAGTGQVAIAAARRGARVVATDITPAMIEWGKEESAAAGVDIEWREADAEDLPFEGDRFDRVLSGFGAIFAPNPDTVARELFRVAKPGGKVGLSAWTPDSWFGRRIVASVRRSPAPDPEAGVRWGDPGYVRERFAAYADDVRFERRSAHLEFGSPEELEEHFERVNGPQIALRNILPAEQYAELRRELLALTEELNQGTDGSVRIDSDWLLVLATKKGAAS
jgi:SAM-dependent methyltransferase